MTEPTYNFLMSKNNREKVKDRHCTNFYRTDGNYINERSISPQNPNSVIRSKILNSKNINLKSKIIKDIMDEKIFKTYDNHEKI